MVYKGKIVDILHRKIFKGQITVKNGKIIEIIPCAEVPNQYILPGFIDAHVHVESSMLIPSEFARLAVKQGTVATVSDPHEIANVLGKEGVEYMIENGNKTPFKFYFGVPSCVPATIFETAGAQIDLDDIHSLFQIPNVNYLAEMMNYPGVLNRDPLVMDKIKLAHKMGKRVDGHAPGLKGEDAKQYIDAGIETDHECYTEEEALDKLRHGMKIIIREGSAAKNFEALWKLIDLFPNDIMFCSDDKHPNDFVHGHINKLVARAIAKGCDIFHVLQVACLNPIAHYQMDIGQLQKGDTADFCIVKDLVQFDALQTIIDGENVYNKGMVTFPIIKEKIINNFCRESISKFMLEVPAKSDTVRVIQVEDGQLITKETVGILPIKDGLLYPDVSKDILKIVVVNRYGNTAPSIGFIQNFGLKKGAIASCVAHDSHNIIAVGTNDSDLKEVINLIIEHKGGIGIAYEAKLDILPLPIAGIMSADCGEKVAEKYEILDQEAKNMGSTLHAPFMTLAFCALLVIPQLKLSDKGLFDGNSFTFVSLCK